MPAAPGILRNTAENVLVLDYGTPESLQIIRERAHELAAVLVEPVQSRRPDFQPVEFLRELREITRDAGALLVFDEVVTGFRAHPGGVQALFGIRADLATYGKVVGGGYPIGVIAGKREYMDALDGGQWQFGDDSIPTVGVTYFAGTFVRHPLALAAAKAVLEHVKAEGAPLQERLNARVTAMVDELNAFCAEMGAPVVVKHFASVWKTFFLEDHPLQDLLFAHDAQPRRAHPRQLPLLPDHRAQRGRFPDDHRGVQGIGGRAAGVGIPAAPRGDAAHGDGRRTAGRRRRAPRARA